ncbi:SGNH/GDSL hydrolase family protein [Aquibacillus kalidii]|uniref:SGNH/GDSL hydrolase family protein n=1 Tax=Aquibacillus kalidii TaxID=2762597 RepID=UPI002E290C65|nr:SGNH/GDSL hydrolase family protein [Aquibacillus kalidii]
MQVKKAMFIIAGLLLVGFLIYIFLPISNDTSTEKTPSSILKEQIEENLNSDTNVADEEQQEETVDSDKPLREEIKDKVKQALEGAIGLFVNQDLDIVAIGDSLTQGVGDETDHGGYVGILNNTFENVEQDITIENFGKRGNRTDQLLKRLDKEEISESIQKADIVLITIGANDIMKVVKNNFTDLRLEQFQTEREDYITRLHDIFDKINSINPDTEIYFIGFYNPFERYFTEIEQLGLIIDNWNDTSKKVAEEYDNVHYIPTKDLFSNSNQELLSDDNFHPNTSGYKLIAQRVLEYLKSSIEEEAE